MHTDSLGNIVSITGNDGEVQLRQASTPFGERISQGLEINTSEKTNTSQPHFHQDNIKGFTGHEQLSSQGLVHMNARLYDPVLGRMLQSDTMIPDTRDPLAYNRYIYVKNNPLKYTDPTGHFGMIVAGFVLLTISATTDDPDVAMVTGIAGALLLGGGLGEAGWTAFQSGGAVGFTQGYLNTGELGEAAKQGAISGVSAQLTYEIAHGGENGTSNFGTGTQLFLQGMVGGTASHLRGGRFQDGFIGAVVSKGVDLGLKGQNLNIYQEGGITVIAGGLSSQAAGGSFEDGAIQAGMVFLYNQNGHKRLTNPTGKEVRGCDRQGCGDFAASRDNGTRQHNATDYVSEKGQNVYAISSGKVVRLPRGKYDGIVVSNGEGTSWKILYVDVSKNISVGAPITEGQVIGTAQDITTRYIGITNHVHVKLRINYQVVNPELYISSNVITMEPMTINGR